MLAWQVVEHGEPARALALAEIEPPEPQPGEVGVRVLSAAIGLPDLFMCRGSYPLTPKLPFTAGQEVAGVVTAAAEESPFRAGERIMGVTSFPRGHGGFAEEALVGTGFAFAVPDELSDAEAAAFPIAFHTAQIGLVRRGRLLPGEHLLVLGGAGGTGSAAIQLGRALGARVLASAGGDEKGAHCRSLGAEVVIDHRRSDLASAVLDATDGRGADVVYDPVGGEMFRAAVECVARGGRILAVGFASGQWADAPTSLLVARNASVVGVFAGAYSARDHAADQEALVGHVQASGLRPTVSRVVDFGDLPAALDELGSRSVVGKLVLAPPG